MIAVVCEQYQVSERRACQILAQRRSVSRYQPQPNRDGEIVKLLLELAHARPSLDGWAKRLFSEEQPLIQYFVTAPEV